MSLKSKLYLVCNCMFYVFKKKKSISTLFKISITHLLRHHCGISYTSLPVCYGILCGNENRAEPLKPTQRWLHHLRHPFWLTLLSSPRPHPPASASNQNGSKWWPPACRASSKTRSFRRRASSRLAENKRSLIHQMLYLPQPTLQNDAVIFTSPHVRFEGLPFFFSFLFFYLLSFLGFIGAPD